MLRVAIVDDSPDIRALWRAELERSGEFVVCAEGDDGRQAAEIALTCLPDVMLLDLSMPGMGGLAALPMVLTASPDTKVVVLSAMGRNQFSQAAMSLGACAFLEKHLPAESLASRLHEALGHAPAPAMGPLVLVVEPDRDHRALLHYLLDWLGHRAHAAHDGAQALAMLAEQPFAAVITAGVLPDMTATEFAARVRRQEVQGRRTPVVAVTTSPDELPELDGSIAALLAKPVAAEALQSALARLSPTTAPAEGTPLLEREYLRMLVDRIGAESLQEILGGFREATRERMRLLRCAVDVADTDGVTRLAHQVRGSARSLAAPRLARAAEELEESAPSCSTEQLRDLAARLQVIVDATVAALSGIPAPRTAGEAPPHEPAVRAGRSWRLSVR